MTVLADKGEAARLEGDVHVAGSHLGDGVERHEEVVLTDELLPDQELCLVLVR